MTNPIANTKISMTPPRSPRKSMTLYTSRLCIFLVPSSDRKRAKYVSGRYFRPNFKGLD